MSRLCCGYSSGCGSPYYNRRNQPPEGGSSDVRSNLYLPVDQLVEEKSMQNLRPPAVGFSQRLLALMVVLSILPPGRAEICGANWVDGLEQPCSVQFFETPLYEALEQLESFSDLVFLLDVNALDSVGLDSGEPITLTLPELPLRQVFECVLKPFDLDYVQRGRIVHVGTAETIGYETRAYRFAFSKTTGGIGSRPIARGGRGGSRFAGDGVQSRGLGNSREDQRAEMLAAVIKNTVCPESWRESSEEGGKGTAMVYGNHLVVYQSPSVHRQIGNLMASLGLRGERSTVSPEADQGPLAEDPFEADGLESEDAAPDQSPEANPFSSSTEDDPFG